MKKTVEIRWHGRGGQGAKTAALLLADVAFKTGRCVQGFPEYGPERMGAPITAFNRISEDQIRVHSNIYDPDYVVVVDETLLHSVHVTDGLKEDGAIIVNTPRSPKEVRSLLRGYQGRVFTVDARRISEETLGRNFPNTPMLGAGGSYLSFVTGNISNLKLPVALNALEQADVKASSEEGEVISTISIAVSSIVTTIIIIIGVLLIRPLTPVLNAPVLAPAFAQMVPALFGALGVVFIAKNVKIAVAPLILMLILFIAVPALNAGTVGIMVPVGVLFTLGVSRLMYKKGML